MPPPTVREPIHSLPPSTPRRRMSYEEYLVRADEHTHSEWVDGAVISMSPVTDSHAELREFIAAVLRLYGEERCPGRVLGEPFQMKLGPDSPGRSPDVFFVFAENLDQLRPLYLEGPADLAVEVVSPDSRTRDRTDKRREYEEGGVREYWILDPETGAGEFLQRGDDGLFHPASADGHGVYHSAVIPGLWLRLEWLQQRPRILGVAREWGLLP